MKNLEKSEDYENGYFLGVSAFCGKADYFYNALTGTDPELLEGYDMDRYSEDYLDGYLKGYEEAKEATDSIEFIGN